MNRRGFIAAAVAAAVAPKELLRPVAAPAAPDYAAIGAAYTRMLARSMMMTKEMISAQVYQAMIYGRAWSLIERDGTIRLLSEDEISGNHNDTEALAGEERGRIRAGGKETWWEEIGGEEDIAADSWGAGRVYNLDRTLEGLKESLRGRG